MKAGGLNTNSAECVALKTYLLFFFTCQVHSSGSVFSACSFFLWAHATQILWISLFLVLCAFKEKTCFFLRGNRNVLVVHFEFHRHFVILPLWYVDFRRTKTILKGFCLHTKRRVCVTVAKIYCVILDSTYEWWKKYSFWKSKDNLASIKTMLFFL